MLEDIFYIEPVEFLTKQIQLIVFSADFIIKIKVFFRYVNWYTFFFIRRFNGEYINKEADTDDVFM